MTDFLCTGALGSRAGKPADVECLDRHVRVTASDEIGNDPPHDGSERDAMAGKTKGVVRTRCGARADDRNAVRHLSLNARPTAHDLNPAQARKQCRRGDRAGGKAPEVQMCPVAVRLGPARPR